MKDGTRMVSPVTASSTDYDALNERVSAGVTLSVDELTRLAESPDILTLGMLADTVRRRLNGTVVTFVRVHQQRLTDPVVDNTIPTTASEIRVSGVPDRFADAVLGVNEVKAKAGGRLVSGLSWIDIERWAPENGGAEAVLGELLRAGLDSLAELPLDVDGAAERGLELLAASGRGAARLTLGKPAAVAARLPQFLRAAALVERFPTVVALAPLPLSLNPLRPTTGYDDVKSVALARLAVPQVPHIQVDWLRYGPKLAQVALTFGADDLDNVSPSEEAPDGRRRAVVEELRKNIESAGFTAVERDGRFGLLA
jgi:aminodeoxyfutalosine synthase